MSAREKAEQALADAQITQWGTAGPTQAHRGVAFAILALADAITAAASTIAARPAAAPDAAKPTSKDELLRRQGINPEAKT